MDTRDDGTVTGRGRRGTGENTARREREHGGGDDTRPDLVSVDTSGDEPDVQLDRQAVRQRAAELLEEWESAGDLEQIRSRTRTVTAVALGVFVLSGVLFGSSTGLTATVASVWLAVSGVVAVTVGTVSLLLRGLRRPRDVADKQGALTLLGIVLLAVGGTHYGRYPAARAAWRYLVTGPLGGGTQTGGAAGADRGVGHESRPESFPLRRYVRLAGGLSAAVVVAHQGWLALRSRDTALSSVVGSGPGVAPGVGGTATGFWTQFTALESVVVLVGVVVLGTLIGALLAASRY